MQIRFHCKTCGSKCVADEALAGENFKCEACGADMRVPMKSTSDPEPDEDTAVEIPGNNHSGIPTDTTATIKVFSVTSATQRNDDIKFECKLCGQKYRLSKEFAGHEAECAKCKRILIIPKYSDSPEDAPVAKIIFWCKKCGQKYRLPQNYAKQEAYCAKCKTTFIVPAKSEDAPPGEAEKKHPEAGHGRPPPEHAEWRPSPVSKYPTEPVITEKVQPPPRTRAQVVQEALTARSLQTQTSIEITGNPVSMVRYVLASPDRNILAAAFSALIDWIRQFSIFKGFSRKFIGFAIIVFCIAAAAVTASKLYVPAKKPETRLVNTMCLDCKFIEARTISNINAAHCSKCKSEVGYAWKCFKCGKVFSREVSKANGDVLLLEKIPPPACPICNSDNVKYIPPEPASAAATEPKPIASKH